MGTGCACLARSVGQISAHSLPDFVNDVLERWIGKKARFNSFAEYVDSEGAHDIADMCDRYRATQEVGVHDPALFDWGASKAFSLDGRGAGECSAGPTS